MVANYLIGLREGLEAGLIVGILVAYLVKLTRGDLLNRLWIGVAVAVAVSLGVGALLTWGPYALTFQAQEVLGGVLSLAAVGMVTWMIFWMSTRGASLSGKLRHQTDAAIHRSWFAIALLGAVTVGREGIETALFVWANVAGGSNPMLGTFGAVLGVLTAIAISWGISRGLVRFNLSVFFTWTGVFLIFVAAGVFAYAIGDLQEASIIPGGAITAFSIAEAVPPGSWYGALLGGIFNFTPEPTWIQVIGWLAYVTITVPLYLWQLRKKRPAPVSTATTVTPATQPSASVTSRAATAPVRSIA